MTDDKNKIELNRRRVLGGIVTVGAAAAAAGAGTSAFFFDEETTNNEITAGSLELNSVSGEFTITDVYPGDQTTTQRMSATYNGGVSAEFDFDVAVSDATGDAGNETGTAFAQNLLLDNAQLSIGGNNVNDYSGSYSTLDAFAAAAPFDNVTQSLSDGDTITLDLQFTLDSGTSNDFQGEGAAIDVTFTAEQPSRD